MFITAKQARVNTSQNIHQEVRKTVVWLKTHLESAIKDSIDNGRNSATANLPSNLDRDVLQKTVVVLKNLGYKVSVDNKSGFLSPGLYRAPQVTLTLYW